ncbi:MAG: alanine--tRNA ligase [Fimbriimonadales bacterium]
MTARELRKKYLEFFESKGHTVHASGSLVPYDVTGRLDESLLFNGAGMVQFKPYFRGVAQPPNKRLATAQKCVRTGDIESVGNLSHLTFFEMLGNFSFGDYFKKEAIAYSWEFLTSPQWLGLDPNRLSFTVFEEDDEAYGYWCEHLAAAGLDPSIRVFRLGEETNYWPAGAFSGGPPGPCGPNSEMFYWTRSDVPPPTGPYTVEDWLRDDEAKNWLEIWNDVFIQFEWQGELRNPDRPSDGFVKTGMPSLPFQSIDTGMGLERTAAVLGGFRSVYDTDVFTPIIAKICSMCTGGYVYGTDGHRDTAMRIIADHIRTACFCIADGVLPGNSGRGYVLRRLIRRAVLKGLRVLGFDKPFFHLVFEGVREALGDHYTELNERKDVIAKTLLSEEELFRRTIASGSAMLQDRIQAVQLSGASELVLDGRTAFQLYDTYGFPLEVTKELCDEAGIAVDEVGYEAAMKEAQERSRGASGMESVYGGVGVTLMLGDQTGATTTPTRFLGYDATEADATIVAVMATPDGELGVALDQTPFYAESGGQVSDTGRIQVRFDDPAEAATIGAETLDLKVVDLVKQDGIYVHLCEVDAPAVPKLSQDDLNRLFLTEVVHAEVDAQRRRRITRNHTATHLLHAALRRVLGNHVTQAGSLVSPEHLRFDFTHGKAMTPEELDEVERLVNEHALAGDPVVIHNDLPIEEAKAKGAMALFGEKYGDRVRMVEVPGFSLELCGGVHVRQTSEIGLFKILHESSAASGVRRIEAVTGDAAYAWAREQSGRLHEAAELLKTSPKDLVPAVERTLETLRDEKRRREKAELAMARGGSGGEAKADFETVGSHQLWRKTFRDLDQKIVAAAVDDAVASNPAVVAVAAVVADGKITFICKAGAQAVAAGAHAGNLVREIAKIAGGGGGGRPDFATAGGKDASKVDAAMAAVPELL